jgi:hypothetical protein
VLDMQIQDTQTLYSMTCFLDGNICALLCGYHTSPTCGTRGLCQMCVPHTSHTQGLHVPTCPTLGANVSRCTWHSRYRKILKKNQNNSKTLCRCVPTNQKMCFNVSKICLGMCLSSQKRRYLYICISAFILYASCLWLPAWWKLVGSWPSSCTGKFGG